MLFDLCDRADRNISRNRRIGAYINCYTRTFSAITDNLMEDGRTKVLKLGLYIIKKLYGKGTDLNPEDKITAIRLAVSRYQLISQYLLKRQSKVQI